jgi:NAD(P)-dependent dehydrogenase (short-subunit alcohol dehydrogenase family)
VTTSGATGRLTGKTVLITGGARGQGAAHAERLAREEATVYACDVLHDEGGALAERLRVQGLDVTYRDLDVTEATAWQALCREIGQRTGGVDVLINNAGIIHVAPIPEQARDAWDATLAVNLTGAMLGIQAVVPGMRSRGGSGRGGSVINIASIFGVVGAPGYAAYCASKAGLIALTKVAALELAADNIRVNVIVPGGVSTPMNEHEKEGGVIPDTPLRRRAHPSEISGAVVFLASEDSSFVTGSELIVDGGYLAR